MKLAGFLLLLAGWGIDLAALVMLAPVLARGVFVLAGIGVELLGLVLVVRSHLLHLSTRKPGVPGALQEGKG